MKKEIKPKKQAVEVATEAIASISVTETSQQEFITTHTRNSKEFLLRLTEAPFKVADDADFLFVNDFLKFVKDSNKEIEKRRKLVTDPLNAALKAFRSWYSPPAKVYKTIEVILKQGLIEYELERKQRDEAAMLAMAQASSEGDYDAAHEASMQMTGRLEAKGLTISEHWDYEVTDEKKLPRWVLGIRNDIVMQYIKDAKPNKPEAVPGLRFFKTGTATRR